MDAPPDQPDFPGARARFQNIVALPCGSACDGKLFIQCVFDQSRVLALDCSTGERRWTFQAAGWIGPAPTIVNDRGYIASQDSHLYCLEHATGRIVWKFKAPGWLASLVAVHDGKVFLPCHRGRLLQLSAKSGEKIQTFETTDESDRKSLEYSFPIIASRNAYFTTGNGQVYAVDIDGSKLTWKLRPAENSELFTDPATDGRCIYVTSRQVRNDAGENNGGENAIIAIGHKR